MTVKLEKGTWFYTRLRRARDPSAPEVTFFRDFFDKNSSIFELCHRAYIEGCSRGGTNKWKVVKAALTRRANKEPLLVGDKERIEGWENFEDSRSRGGTNNWKLTEAALDRKKNNQPPLDGDKERIEYWEAFQAGRNIHLKKLQKAAQRRREGHAPLPGDKKILENIDKAAAVGGQKTKDAKDERYGRTSDTMFLCLYCMKKNEVAYAMLPKGENFTKGLLKDLPKVNHTKGKAACKNCKKNHSSWAVINKGEEMVVKAGEFPERIKTTMIMCEREGCVSKPYGGHTICRTHYGGRR